ncbi:MAG: hypothetical protein HQ539_01380, partial [Parcubacteria group bacterium]|nr:hypothetical protein [Parcubacteria group bacterium]
MILSAKKFKKAIFVLVCAIFLLSLGGTVFALDLELDYPTIPGVGNVEKGLGYEEPGEQMAYFAKYVLRLAFYIVLGVCIIVLIIAGVMYITANQKPSALTEARLMVQRALLGLVILIGSYSVLYLINPQLLILDVDLVEPGEANFGQTLLPGDPASVINVIFFNPLNMGLTAVNNAATEEYSCESGMTEPGEPCFDDNYRMTNPLTVSNVSIPRQGIFASIFNRFLRPSPVVAGNVEPMVYLAELPLRRTEKLIDKLSDLIEGIDVDGNNSPEYGLEELLGYCKCGESKVHTKWSWDLNQQKEGIVRTYSAIFNGACKTGVPEWDEEKWWKENEKTSQNMCLTQSTDCGTAVFIDSDPEVQKNEDLEGKLKCDLREVLVQYIPVAVDSGGTKETIEFVFVQTKQDDIKTEDTIEAEGELIDWNPIDWVPPDGWLLSSIATFKLEESEKTNREKIQGALIKEPTKINIEKPFTLSDDAEIDKNRTIKYKRYRLQKLVAQLEGMKDVFFPEQIGPVDMALGLNAVDYAQFYGVGGMFGKDFDAKKQEWEEQGYVVELKPLKAGTSVFDEALFAKVDVPPPTRFEKFLSFFVAPVKAELQTYKIKGTNLFLITDGPLPEHQLDRNKYVEREASRASLFSVLTDLTLERIQDMFKMCLNTAFGEADYDVSDDMIRDALSGALKDRVGTDVAKIIGDNVSELVEAVGDTYADTIKEKIEYDCAVDKCSFNPPTDINKIKEKLDEHKETKEYEVCINNCIKENISPDFTSKMITGFLKADIDTWFGDTVKEGLDSKIREVFKKDINAQLEKPMGQFYDAVLQGLLSQSIKDKVPKLKGALDTKLTELPFFDVVLGQLGQIDSFLTCRISGCCRPVKGPEQCVEEIYSELSDGEIKQCVVKNHFLCKSDNPIEHSTIGECEAACGVGNCIAGPARNVASEYQCKKEVYRQTDGKKECCEQGLRQVIDKLAEDKVKSLARKYTTQKASKLIGDFRKMLPSLFAGSRGAEDCNLEEGFFFRPDMGFKDQFISPPDSCLKTLDNINGGECIKMTPKNITYLGDEELDADFDMSFETKSWGAVFNKETECFELNIIPSENTG